MAKRRRKSAPRKKTPRKHREFIHMDPEEMLAEIEARDNSNRPGFKPEYVAMARVAYRKGWTDREVAELFGTHFTTIRNWALACPEFARVRQEAKEVADERVERALYERAVGYEIDDERIFHTNEKGVVRVMTKKHIPAEIAAQKYWLGNRQRDRWRDRQEITGADGAPLVEVSDAPKRPMIEIARRIVFALQRAEDEQNGGPQPLLIEEKITATEG